jgi:hypothetical protein
MMRESNANETSRFYDDNLASTFLQVAIDIVIMDPTLILGYDRENAEFLKIYGFMGSLPMKLP